MQGDATADGFGNDVCKVEPEEPGIADDGTVVYIANYCKNQKYNRDEIQETGDINRSLPSLGSSLDVHASSRDMM